MNLRNLRFVSAVPVVISLASGLAVAQSKKSTSEGVVTASYKTPNDKGPAPPMASRIFRVSGPTTPQPRSNGRRSWRAKNF